MTKASDRQIGGDHYKKLKIQPMTYSLENGLNAAQHTIVKYVTRYRDKGGLQDLEKALHTLELLIEHERKGPMFALGEKQEAKPADIAVKMRERLDAALEDARNPYGVPTGVVPRTGAGK